MFLLAEGKRSLADFRGKVLLVDFGYTHCPDVCPTVLSELVRVKKHLGADARWVIFAFVTVDPARDTPAVLARYLPYFDSGFLGLRGDASELAEAAKNFHIAYEKQPLAAGGYSLAHTAGTFLLDSQGRLRAFAGYAARTDAIVHDLRLLLPRH